MGDAPLVRVSVHQPPEGGLQRGAPLAGTLDFRAGREAAAGGSAPQCTEVVAAAQTHTCLQADALHSRDAGRGQSALQLVVCLCVGRLQSLCLLDTI